MGSSFKFAYTVIGDSVNLAARLEGANKIYGSRILMAQTTADLVRGQFLVRKLDVLRVKGKQRPMPVYELLGEAPGDDGLRARAAGYEAAFALHCARQWDGAAAALRALLERFPTDQPAAALLARVNHLRDHPPPPDWDGVYVAEGK
jgi:adenylate cyclase